MFQYLMINGCLKSEITMNILHCMVMHKGTNHADLAHFNARQPITFHYLKKLHNLVLWQQIRFLYIHCVVQTFFNHFFYPQWLLVTIFLSNLFIFVSIPHDVFSPGFIYLEIV